MAKDEPNVNFNIANISDRIIKSQFDDVKLHTTGHLNESNLWKPPDDRQTYRAWESANKAHLLLRPPHVFKKHQVNDSLVSDMCDVIADFTLGTSINIGDKRQQQQQQQQQQRVQSSKKDVYIEELKLPNIIVAKKPTGSVLSQQTPLLPSTSHFYSTANHKYESLPRLHGATAIDEGLPKSDIEIAYKIIDGPFTGVTKQEKYKNLKKFEQNVIQKSDLTNMNVLNDTHQVRKLEEKLIEKLKASRAADNDGANFHRLQIYSSIFEEILLEKNIFGDLLHDIKKEYDLYLNHLLDKQSNSGSQLMHQAELAERSGFSKKVAIKLADEEIENLELLVEELYAKQNQLKVNIKEEKQFYNEKMDEINRKIHHSYTEQITKMETNVKQNETIADKIDLTRDQILSYINDLTHINDVLNKDYVPNAVINNLLQSIKDTEIESEKLLKQNEFLEDELKKKEHDLVDFLMKNDPTEFAPDNVDFLMKALKNLDVIQLAEIPVAVEESASSNMTDEEANSPVIDEHLKEINQTETETETETEKTQYEQKPHHRRHHHQHLQKQQSPQKNKNSARLSKSGKKGDEFLNIYDDYFS